LKAILSVTEFHDTLCSDSVGEQERLLVFLFVRPCPFRNKIHFQILIRPLTIQVYVEIRLINPDDVRL